LEKKSPDELVAMAAKSPEEIKESLYRQAIAKAMESDDPARARQIAKDFLPNGGLGDPMVAEIEQKEREQALKQGKLEEARKSLARLRSDEERTLALIELAVRAEANKDQKTQRQLLEEARGLLGDQMDTRMQVEAQLALAIACLSVDADRSFEILGSAVDRLNTVMGAVMVLTRFDQGGSPYGATSKEGEMRLNAGEFGNVTTNLDQRIVAFARKDFDRTVAALKRWEVNEIRLAMNLMLASYILGENKEVEYSHPFFGERILFGERIR
jgi:tetratricopeptide (TPR) repeat protein